MSAADKDKKNLLSDLENIKDLLDDPSDSTEPPRTPSDIPVLSDVVPPSEHSPVNQASETSTDNSVTKNAVTNNPAAKNPRTTPDKPNPFIPYDAINKLKKERQSMRNFAAEVMQAAQQGIHKSELDSFDLFKYSKNSTSHDTSVSNTKQCSSTEKNSAQDTVQSSPQNTAQSTTQRATSNTDDSGLVSPRKPEAVNALPHKEIQLQAPDEFQLQAMINDVIEAHRPLLEEALKDALTNFYQEQLTNKTSGN
jgi:hypothetical protein